MNDTTMVQRGCLRWLWLTVFVILLDQITKNMVLKYFLLHQVKTVLPIFKLTLAYNKGAAFSFLSNEAGSLYLFGAFAAIVSIGLLIWLAKLPKNRHVLAAALALILAGALGNLIDRVYHGHVIDFLLFHWKNYYWPAFNVADTAITIGVVLFLIDAFFLQGKVKRQEGADV